MRPRIVALTGGIGSGKSAVSSYLRTKGVAVYDSDSSTKMLYDTDDRLLQDMEGALGCPLRNEDGRMDRALLSNIIFNSPELLSTVESIVHPAVLEDFTKWADSQDSEWSGYALKEFFVVIESAIALRSPLFRSLFDAVVLVDAPLELRIERTMLRDGSSREKVLSIIQSQSFDLDDIDQFILNDSDLDTLHNRTDIAFKNIIFA